MVRDLLERITAPVRRAVMRPIRSLHQAAYLLAGLTLVSQILALLRDRIFAATFGAGQTLDLYYGAFRVPDLVFAFVSSLVGAYVLIPRITASNHDETEKLLSESATFLLVVGGGISLGLFVGMPQFLAFLYPHFTTSPNADQFVALSRLLLLQPILLGLSGVVGSVAQVHRRFMLFALSPLLYNVGIIFGALVLYPRCGLLGLGGGVVLGALCYLLMNVPVLREIKLMPHFRFPRLSEFLPIVRDSVPRSLALGMGSITLLFLTAIASRVGEGAVSVFTFAINLESVPLGLIGASYAVAAFPSLSEAATPERREEFVEILSASARHVILWSLVALGLIAVLRAHIVRAILGAGAFDWNATRLTAALLLVLAIGLAAQGLILLFSRALYALRQSWRPLLYQVVSGGLSVLLAVLFLAHPESAPLESIASFLKVNHLPGVSVLLVAVASTVGQFVLLLLSFHALHTAIPGLSRTLRRSAVDGGLAALVGGFSAYLVLAIEGGIAPLTTLAAVVVQGALAGVVGLIGGALALWYVENEEFMIAAQALKRLLRSHAERSSALPPSADEPHVP